ncbi:peptidase S41 [Methyloceanibacter marginalis]|jgi:carboxyl-terminal processing protease|uniref:Peptidase S41 n=2 Tax=Methyloceanibacter marginalis TaxID=1774971 RepID=A0A1E3W8J8_9HYPH|nr:peptidase S41 [Methyloceanibacter marginalis]
MMRRSEYALWALLVLAVLAAGSTMVSLARSQSASAANSEIYKQLDLFGEVLERVRADYVEEPEDAKLIESAINGMLTALDPHSAYLNPKHFRDMQVQTRGEFGGLGIEVTMEDGVVKVVAPIEDTPAARAGLMSGDLITHLDKEQILGLTLQEAVEKMRGPVNSPIGLTIVRKGVEDPFEVKVVRDMIHINPVKYNAEGEDVGYIRVTTFNEQTTENLQAAVDDLKKKLGPNLKGYVIDLRNNPGGLLDQAISVSDAFLDQGAIVLTRGRNLEETQRSNARQGDITDGKKIVVLINGGSASASEIVAGALQDHERATVVGTRSFGKGSVQTIIPLGSNGALRLTTARYYTPSGRSIQAKGIDPEIVVEEELPEELKKKQEVQGMRGESNLRGHLRGEFEDDEEESGSSSYVPEDKAKDTQLNYALDLLRGIKSVDTDSKKKAEAN